MNIIMYCLVCGKAEEVPKDLRLGAHFCSNECVTKFRDRINSTEQESGFMRWFHSVNWRPWQKGGDQHLE
jgi:predicted nucleic acid-binding Zn ribbon protein